MSATVSLRKDATYIDKRGVEWSVAEFLYRDGLWWVEHDVGTHVNVVRPNPQKRGHFIGKILSKAAFVKSVVSEVSAEHEIVRGTLDNGEIGCTICKNEPCGCGCGADEHLPCPFGVT